MMPGYRRQVSNGAYENALAEMQKSANSSSHDKMKQLNEMFEINFAQNQRLQSKLKLLSRRNSELRDKIIQEKSELEKQNLNKKLVATETELEQINEKLLANESELKLLQESYRKLRN